MLLASPACSPEGHRDLGFSFKQHAVFFPQQLHSKISHADDDEEEGKASADKRKR